MIESIQLQSLAARVAALPKLPMKALWALWDKNFPRRPSHHHRTYVEGRVAFKIQEEALGGIKHEARQQLIKIGEAQSKFSTRRKTEICVVPGTVLVREYDNHEHRVTAQADGSFEFAGQRFNSLSAVARHITGSQWSGPVFFGLVKTQRRTK
ncbi:MAG: DUF2924 domain-containing protein [Betaproteobacteria bacterium]|nr:DUF2924 domain-containing protein [Betaproteobacteria bacterium]